MKLAHLSDLHIGKRVNEYSMLEDQAYILTRILNILDENKADGVIIAGDIYDKSVPSAEAVGLFDSFLVSLAKRKLKTFLISGNHDSAERIAFGGRLMTGSGIYVSPVYDGNVTPITLEDEYGKVNIWLLPFIKPANVRSVFPEEKIETYTDAVAAAVTKMNPDFSQRNVIVTHQFITGSLKCESEELSVGGTDNVDAAVFRDFDYVALGHIHRPQNCTSEKIRYCGTPLKYSFSEVKDKKSVTFVELKEKGEVKIGTVPLKPKREMHEIKGSYDELMLKSFYENTTYREDYMHITLTDEQDIPDAVGKLRTVYRNLMKLDYDNQRTRNSKLTQADRNPERKSPFELFSDFYYQQNGQKMSEEQQQFIKELLESIKEDER